MGTQHWLPFFGPDRKRKLFPTSGWLILVGGKIFHLFNFIVIGDAGQQQADEEGENFGNRKCQPNLIEGADAGNDPCAGQQDDQLAQHRDEQRVFTFADGLEKVGKGDAQTGSREAQTDGAQSGDADVHHICAGVEHHQQVSCAELENQQTDQHDAKGNGAGELEGVHQTLFVACAVVKAHDGQCARTQTEDRHKDKRLELKVDTQNGDRCLRKDDEDVVERHNHDRANRLHDDGRKADLEDVAHDGAGKVKAFEGDVYRVLLAHHDIDGVQHCQNLTGNGGNRCTGDTHGRQTEPTKDKDGVKDDVGDGANQLEDHRVEHISGCLKGFLQIDLDKAAEGEDGDDGGVIDTHLDDGGVTGEGREEHPAEEQSEQ